MDAEYKDLNIGEYLEHTLPDLRNNGGRVPLWPPDVFGLCASLLVKSGSYGRVLASWPSGQFLGIPLNTKTWPGHARTVGKEWRESWSMQPPGKPEEKDVPSKVVECWEVLREHWKTPLRSLNEQGVVPWSDVMQLLAFADEACSPVGWGLEASDETGVQAFLFRTTTLLGERELEENKPRHGASLCLDIHPSRLRVLPKYHTPSSGLTIRSLSQHLALAMPCEVVPKFGLISSRRKPEDRLFNILVVPWPYDVERSQFVEVKEGPGVNNLVPGFGFFSYRHGFHARWPNGGEGLFIVDFVEDLLKCAEREAGPIRMVVFPESAVSSEQAAVLSQHFRLKRPQIFLACGYGEASSKNKFGTNRVGLTRYPIEFGQEKHHRWKLDRRQLQQYTLAGYLRPERTYYEHIGVDNRELCFIVSDGLSIATLICEDLARPDPVGDIIRSVGPNLVVALLMDGPQIRERWAGRYASVLADDPGSSVLSVTSLGMANLSRPFDGQSRSRVIGLWKDVEMGAKEITLEPDAHAVVVSTTLESREEWSADGRSDTDETLPMRGNAIYPQFFAALSIKASNDAWPKR